ncbi:hypothetical protein MKW94_009747, partial [Papaver nudicaule]|nr:hypothetical protein [Papaver nudicaule]
MENGTKKNSTETERHKQNGLLSDLEVKEQSKTECIEQLQREIRCLNRANVIAETGTEIWKKKYKELESKKMKLKEAEMYDKKELEGYRLENCELLQLVEEKRKECVGLEEKLTDLRSRKDVVDSELNGLRFECSELKEQVAKLEENVCLLLNVKDRCEQLERKNTVLEIDAIRLEKEQALVCEREKVALGRIANLCDELQKLRREKNELIRTGSVDCETLQKGDKNNPIEIEDIIIEISDTEDDSGNADDLPSNNRIERPLSGQRGDKHSISCKKEPKQMWAVEGRTLASCKQELELSPTPKRKWVADTVKTEVLTEDEEKRKKLHTWQNVLLERFSMEMQTPIVSLQTKSIEENKCLEYEKASHGERMTLSGIGMNETLHEKVGNTNFVGEKENVVNEVGLNGKQGEGCIPENSLDYSTRHGFSAFDEF